MFDVATHIIMLTFGFDEQSIFPKPLPKSYKDKDGFTPYLLFTSIHPMCLLYAIPILIDISYKIFTISVAHSKKRNTIGILHSTTKIKIGVQYGQAKKYYNE